MHKISLTLSFSLIQDKEGKKEKVMGQWKRWQKVCIIFFLVDQNMPIYVQNIIKPSPFMLSSKKKIRKDITKGGIL